MCLGMPSISPLHGDGARDGGCRLWCAVLPRPSCARLGRCHPIRAYVARDAIGFWEVPYLSLTSSWCLIVHQQAPVLWLLYSRTAVHMGRSREAAVSLVSATLNWVG